MVFEGEGTTVSTSRRREEGTGSRRRTSTVQIVTAGTVLSSVVKQLVKRNGQEPSDMLVFN